MRFSRRPVLDTEVDLVFVVAEQNRGWVLDGICRDIEPHVSGVTAYCYDVQLLPSARSYFFSHYSLFVAAARAGRIPRGARTFVYFTHPRDIGLRPRRLIKMLAKSDQVLSMASMHTEELVRAGLPRNRVTTVLGAADPGLFPWHRRGSGRALLVSAYYPRKSPETMLALIRALPDTPFTLLGKGWRNSPVAASLAALSNLELLEAPYSMYPAVYGRSDAFVSVSALEGGPIPLIEAMMSNVIPVATRTGFAPDLIHHGRNGFLCDVDAPVVEIAELVKQALRSSAEVRASVEHLDWKRYASFVGPVRAESGRASPA